MRWIYRKVKLTAKVEREKIFMGTEDFILLPNENIKGQEIKSLLKDNQYKGKNVTRKLIEYFHAPVDCHVENMANGELYKELIKIVYPMLIISKEQTDNLLNDIFKRRGYLFFNNEKSGLAIIRDEIIPIVVEFFHIHIFGKPSTKEALDLLTTNVILFKESISFISFPDMKIRQAVLDYILSQCSSELLSDLRSKVSIEISDEKIAKLIMGVFFHTGVIQISEFVAHTIVALSQNVEIQARLKNNLTDNQFLQRILDETLRIYPLFGITNRIAEQDYHMRNGQMIPEGMNIIFDFIACHAEGVVNPKVFNPDRWIEPNQSDNCYMPFGAGPRMCPAKRFAYNITASLVIDMIKNYSFVSSIEHDRPLTGGGLVYFFSDNQDIKQRIKRRLMLPVISFKEALVQRRYCREVIKNCEIVNKTDFLAKLVKTDAQDMHTL